MGTKAEEILKRIYDNNPGYKSAIDRVLSGLIDPLGESPEAWRGAEVALVFMGSMLMAADQDNTSMKQLITAYAAVVAGFISQPAVAANRKREQHDRQS